MPATAMTWAVAVPLAAFIIYRRMPRNSGRRPLRVDRLAFRSLLVAVVAGLLLIAGLARHDDLNDVGTKPA